jgi:Na+/H+-dicarboxylate symporter
MTVKRLVGVTAATAVGFVVGFYAGFFLLLSTVGLDEFEGWQFEISTVPAAGLVAGIAAVAASADRQRIWRRVIATSILTALAVAVGLLLLDGDFGVAMGVGGPLVVGTTVLAAWSAVRHRDQQR